MDCRDFSENLQAYIDNELSEVERAALEEHLQDCARCTGELRELMMVNKFLEKAFAKKPPTAGLMARVIARITGPARGRKAAAAKAEREDIEDDPSTKLAGQTLGGYKIAEKIGSGGMGTVYRAEQLSMGRNVALKVLYQKYYTDETFVKRFIREARSAGGLNHANIVRVYDVGHEKGFYFMSQEFVQGRSVHQMLVKEGRLEPELALDVVIQTARALEHAQKRSIIHRDVKPENIIVDEEGHIKLADLGLAKKIGITQDAAVTLEGQIMGTPQYMSPEQVIDSSTVDHRSDIYSLGASFYFMVTGRKPFEGKSAMEAMVAVIHDDITFTREQLTFVPKQIVKVIDKMTAKNPDRRYQTATELLKELEHVRNRPLTHHAPAAPPRPRAVRAAAARREREPSSALEKKASNYMWLAAVAAGLLIVVGLWVALRSPEEDKSIVVKDEGKEEEKFVPAPPPPAPPHDETLVKKPEVESEAKKEFEAVRKLIGEHPDDYAEYLTRLKTVFEGYPDSKYASNAQTLYDEIVKKLNRAFDQAKAQSERFTRLSNYNSAIALWKEFEQKHAGTDVAETAASHASQLSIQQRSRFRRDMKLAESLLEKGDTDHAITEFERVLKYGTEEMKKEANAEIAAIERDIRTVAKAKKRQEQLEVLDKFYRRTVEHMMAGQYGRTVEEIDTAAVDPQFALIKEYIDLERTDVVHLIDLETALEKAFREMAVSSMATAVKLKGYDRAIVGKVTEMSRGVFVIYPKDKKDKPFISLKLDRIAQDEVVRLTKSQFKDATEAHMKYYLYYLYEANFAQAIAYLDKLSGRKRVVVEKKQAAKPKGRKDISKLTSDAEKRLKELMKKYGKDLPEEERKKLEKEKDRLAEGKPAGKPGQPEAVEKIIDPGDPKYAICYDKFNRVKPLITAMLLERTAKKLHDSAKFAYRKKDYEEAQDILERLFSEEFEKVKYLDKSKRDEIARLLKNVESKSKPLTKRELEKDEIASLFNAAKVEKLRSGKYRVTYDFTKAEQLKDFTIGRDTIKDNRIKELFAWRNKKSFKYEEAPAWAVVRYQKYSMVNGKGNRAFMWKGIIDGDVTLEFSAIPQERQNVIGLLCYGEEGAYALATSYRGGDADWHRNKFGLTRSVVFRRYWDDDPRTRLLNGGWQVIGDAGKKIVAINTAYKIKASRKGNKLSFSVNGQRYVEGSDNTWNKGRVGVWARESNVLYTSIRITGKLDKEWVEKELKRLGRKKKQDLKKKKDDKIAKKEDPYKGASEATKRLLDTAKKLDGITNEDLMRLRKVADKADGIPGGWGKRMKDRVVNGVGRLKNAEELRRWLNDIEGWLDPGNNPWGPGRGRGGIRPGGGRGGP
jgi:serine/threonine protein kinase